MKRFILLCLAMNCVYAADGIDVQINNESAQSLYNNLNVPEDGAAGHIFKYGKDVVCIRTNAEIDDAQGKLIPQEDPRRYVCKVHFDNKGIASKPKVY